MVEAYPLYWPVGWKRTKHPVRSRFGRNRYDNPSIEKGRQFVKEELRRMGATNPIVSTNQVLRLDGAPYSNRREPDDKGVAVYFHYEGGQRVIACDAYNDMGSNLYAIGKTIEAMRGIDRWGCSEILARAFQGFKALPQQGSVTTAWWVILEVSEHASVNDIRAAYRALSKKYHPDNTETGNTAQFRIVNEAYTQAMATQSQTV